MTTYQVTWTIDVDADDHEGATREALRIMHGIDTSMPDSATVFKVREYGVGRYGLVTRLKRVRTIDLFNGDQE